MSYEINPPVRKGRKLRMNANKRLRELVGLVSFYASEAEDVKKDSPIQSNADVLRAKGILSKILRENPNRFDFQGTSIHISTLK